MGSASLPFILHQLNAAECGRKEFTVDNSDFPLWLVTHVSHPTPMVVSAESIYSAHLVVKEFLNSSQTKPQEWPRDDFNFVQVKIPTKMGVVIPLF